METLTKKQFADTWGLDGSLNGSRWQKEEKKAKSLCNYEKTGKNRGIRYIVLEVYDTPKEIVHGNTGKTPHNKGKIDENSLKYQLAKLLVLSFGANPNDYQTKNSYMQLLDITGRNIKHMEKIFDDVKYDDLHTANKYVFQQLHNTQLSLKRLMGEAFRLIRNGTFLGVTLHEKLCVAFRDESHEDADEALEDSESLYLLYKEAQLEAKQNIENEYGTSMFFTTRMKFINCECQELIESEEKYQLLNDNDIAYFYHKYAIDGVIEAQDVYDYESLNYDGTDMLEAYSYEEMTDDFMFKFKNHRKEASVKYIDRLIKKGVSGDFLNKGIMMKFADEVLDLMFRDDDNKRFNGLYANLMKHAKQEYQEDLEEYVTDGLSEMNW
ncbi:hypothetical protein [Priestia megaterium]|uniref:hypothetical protein n=1 Tax=Priestia megaterium TaxID=1404 RepID=UPI000BF480AE|nr:hypothetical protein [Priestia megaterium]PFT58086.1 hypothetical protein COK68_00725 [Priestia megaterium]